MIEEIVWYKAEVSKFENAIDDICAQGLKIHVVDNWSDLENFVEEGAALAIVDTSVGRESWEICEKLGSEYPDLSTLYLVPNKTAVPDFKISEGHEVYYLPYERESLVSRTRALLSEASHVVERRWNDRFVDSLDELADNFDIRDLNISLIESLRFLQTQFHCDNVFWFKVGELSKSMDEAIRGEDISFQSLDEIRQTICPMMAGRPFTVEKLTEFLVELQNALPKDWQSTTDFVEVTVEGKRHCLFPMVTKDIGETVGYFVMADTAFLHPWMDRCISLLRNLVSRQITQSLQFDAVKSMSYIDHLTHLYNQRYLPMALDREISRIERYGGVFSVLFLDIDSFKSVNDSHGHLIGSSIISEMGEILAGAIRESDYGFRFGGDEFVLILAESGVNEAQIVAERVRKSVSEHVFKINNEEYQVTVSIGIASCPTHAKSKEDILKLADQAMYEGKRSTKNVVYVAS